MNSRLSEPRDVLGVLSDMTTVVHGSFLAALPVLAALSLSGCVVAQPVVPGPAVGGVYEYDSLPPDYYDRLYGYGAWQTVPGYGAVWCPAVPSAWSPYVYGPGPAWGFTFYFGDWISTPYGWGWLPGHYHHPHWRSWARRGNPRGRRDDRFGRHDRPRRRERDDGHGRGEPGHHGNRGDRHERFVTPTPPRRAWAPDDRRRTTRESRTPVFRERSFDSRPRLEPRREDGSRSRGGRTTPTQPDRTFRSPGVPIAGPPPARGGHRGGGRVDAPRRTSAPSWSGRSGRGAERSAQRSAPAGDGSRGGSGGSARGDVRADGRGSARRGGGRQRGRW